MKRNHRQKSLRVTTETVKLLSNHDIGMTVCAAAALLDRPTAPPTNCKCAPA